MRVSFSIALFLSLFCACLAQSQDRCVEFHVFFPANGIDINPAYSDNAARLQAIKDFLRHTDAVAVTGLSFRGSASPDGSHELGRKLAQGRLSSLERFVRSELEIPDSLVSRESGHIPWDHLKSRVACSDMQDKDAVVAILDESPHLVEYHRSGRHIDNRVVKLQRLGGGKAWQHMRSRYFGHMRSATVKITVRERRMAPSAHGLVAGQDTLTVVRAPFRQHPSFSGTARLPESLGFHPDGWMRRLYIKTNAVGWGMAVSNAAVEVDLARHWSFTIPVYYSAWDYSKPSIKFRTFAIQPEIRYWVSGDNDGFFGGVHLGMAYYNVAVDGDYRYQDQEYPALGGGVNIGYRLPIGRNRHWKVEFALGGGVYALHYDKFLNTPHTKDGLWAGSERRVFWCLDQAAISFMYSFDMKNRKGGKR